MDNLTCMAVGSGGDWWDELFFSIVYLFIQFFRCPSCRASTIMWWTRAIKCSTSQMFTMWVNIVNHGLPWRSEGVLCRDFRMLASLKLPIFYLYLQSLLLQVFSDLDFDQMAMLDIPARADSCADEPFESMVSFALLGWKIEELKLNWIELKLWIHKVILHYFIVYLKFELNSISVCRPVIGASPIYCALRPRSALVRSGRAKEICGISFFAWRRSGQFCFQLILASFLWIWLVAIDIGVIYLSYH